MVTVVDCFIHSYERDAIAVRLCELAGVVDYHLAVQASTTFRYEPREVTLIDHPRVVNVVVDLPSGLTPFGCEQALRDQLVPLARDVAAGALCLVSDGDEIPHPDAVSAAAQSGQPATLLVDYREWFIDWRAPEPWQPEYQPILATPAQIEDRGGATSARQRCRDWQTFQPRGWHLSTLGDAAYASVKLSTFAHVEYDTPEWNDATQLDGFRRRGRDLLDRFDLEPTTDLPACADQFPHLLSPRGAHVAP